VVAVSLVPILGIQPSNLNFAALLLKRRVNRQSRSQQGNGQYGSQILHLRVSETGLFPTAEYPGRRQHETGLGGRASDLIVGWPDHSWLGAGGTRCRALSLA